MIELLIAIVLSSIVVYAAISMFLASRGTANTTTAIGALSDNGRVALDFISESVRSGGAMECHATNALHTEVITPATNIGQKNALNVGATPLQLDYADAFSGFEAVGTGNVGGAALVSASPVAADPASSDWAGGGLDGLLANQVVKGSDVLAARSSIPQAAPAYTVAEYDGNTGATQIFVNDVGNLQPLQYAVISDCSVSAVFQIGTVDPVGNVVTTAGPLTTHGGDLQTTFPVHSALAPIDTAVYYIGAGRDGDSALFRYDEWTGLFQQLVPDVENMQVLYGVAITPTVPSEITQYVTADQVVDFNQVVSVQVALLVASAPGSTAVPAPANAPTYNLLGTTVTAPIDTRLRKVFQTTIAVQNAVL
jgi:type II secretory pathway pseudopilin PulG